MEKLTIRIFALEIRVVYFRDGTTWIFAIKIRVVYVIERLISRIFAEKKSVVYLKRLDNSHFVTNIKMKIVLYGPR